jgi:uncharacterized protein
VQLERHADADSFLARAGAFLGEREAEHNVILGISGSLRVEPRMYGEDPYFAVALDDERVVAAALRTPPHNLLLSEVDDEHALEALADDVHSVYGDTLSGALGSNEAVAEFVRLWKARTGASARLALHQRLYRAEEALAPEGVSGRMRPYEDRDRQLVLGWMDAFVAEALPEPPPEDSAHWLDRRLADPDAGLAVWEEGDAVSFGSFGGLTPNGIRIGPIYTPPELRRRGYATALVAELTHMLLERGRSFCFLFTDLANPTSNSIYQRVGYRPVTDVDQWSFE